MKIEFLELEFHPRISGDGDSLLDRLFLEDEYPRPEYEYRSQYSHYPLERQIIRE